MARRPASIKISITPPVNLSIATCQSFLFQTLHFCQRQKIEQTILVICFADFTVFELLSAPDKRLLMVSHKLLTIGFGLVDKVFEKFLRQVTDILFDSCEVNVGHN